MPIRAENRLRYPKTWKQMVAQAAERSGGRCECDGKCGVPHEGGRCDALNGQPHPQTGSRVVLTLAHEHGVALEETSITRMFHACQRCHNRYDAPVRRAGMMRRANARQAELWNWTAEDIRLGEEQIAYYLRSRADMALLPPAHPDDPAEIARLKAPTLSRTTGDVL